jgi:Holliday junction resolvase RusA-like endonuclease
MKITIPYPPSANDYYRSIGRGRMLLSSDGRNYKTAVTYIAYRERMKQLEGELVIYLDLFRPQKSGDLDNRIKPVLDALIKNAYADDKQIVEIHARRWDDKVNPRVEVRIESIALPSTDGKKEQL